jgi:GT2 family glycosyltransferase
MKWLDRGVQFDFHSLKVAFLERVGGFDEERFPFLYEDLDWGYRARQHGLRVLYNRLAIVDHWKPITLDGWHARAPQQAVTEWRFCQLYPEIEPHFFRFYSQAATRPPVRGRGVRLVRFVPRWVPWLGKRVWNAASLYWRQQIAPGWLAAWEEVSSGARPPAQPDGSVPSAERAANSE